MRVTNTDSVDCRTVRRHKNFQQEHTLRNFNLPPKEGGRQCKESRKKEPTQKKAAEAPLFVRIVL